MKTKFSFAMALCFLFYIPTITHSYQLSFTPGITLTEEYNDNIFLIHENEEDDYITIVTANLLFEFSHRGSGLELTYNPGHSLYSKNSEFNTWRHEALLSAWVEMTRNTRFEIENAYLFTEDPLSPDDVISPITEDPLIPDDPTIRQGREPYYTNTVTARIIRQFGADDSFFIEYSYYILKNDDLEVEDEDRHTPSIGVTYWFLPRWGFELEGSFTDTEMEVSNDFDEWYGSAIQTYRYSRHLELFFQYEHTSVQYTENQEQSFDFVDYQVYEPSTGFTYNSANDFLFTLRLGYYSLDREDGEDDSGPSGEIELTKTLRNGSISISGEAGQDNTTLGAENLGFTEFYEIGFDAEYNLLRNLVVDGSLSFRNALFEETEEDREDDILTGSIGLAYEATNWLEARLEYRHRALESTLPEDEYVENRVSLSLTFTKPRPYRWTR